MKFTKGSSGNPMARPVGSKGKNTLIDEALTNYSRNKGIDAKQRILDSVISQAIGGDLHASRLILDRLVPPLKSTMRKINIPELPDGLYAKSEKILSLTTNGILSIDEAKGLLNNLIDIIKVKEFTELEQKLEELEKAISKFE